ncbi:hypothetical protein [Pseudogemmobacter sonorensis]|uniref:hypothetical protein n=1 Tax=Pseudogemmobacter sonorensis TaxID=2989681 RepID=UPI0036AEE281
MYLGEIAELQESAALFEAPLHPCILYMMTQGKGICEDNPTVFPEIGRLFLKRLLS